MSAYRINFSWTKWVATSSGALIVLGLTGLLLGLTTGAFIDPELGDLRRPMFLGRSSGMSQGSAYYAFTASALLLNTGATVLTWLLLALGIQWLRSRSTGLAWPTQSSCADRTGPFNTADAFGTPQPRLAPIDLIGALGPGIVAFVLASWGNEFSMFQHADEAKKVDFVMTGKDDFHHPALMLNLVRVILSLAPSTFTPTPEFTVLMGRTLSAIAVGVAAGGTFLLGKKFLRPPWAHLAAYLFALSPVVVVHGHYFKEDALFSACLTLFLLALTTDGRMARLATALTFGLACATQYKALLLLPVYLMVRPPRPQEGLAALGIGLLAQGPALWRDTAFARGSVGQLGHALGGHDVLIFSTLDLGSYHLWHSLVPGLGLPLVLVALVGLIALPPSRMPRWLLLVVLLFYCTAELSPMKPWPDFQRYMMPIAGPLTLIAALFLQTLSQLRHRFASKVATLIGVALLLLAMRSAVEIVRTISLEDTRERAAQHARELVRKTPTKKRVLWERYAHPRREGVESVADHSPSELRSLGFTNVVFSSFLVDRVREGRRRGLQHRSIDVRAKNYDELLSLPHHRIAAESGPVAYFQPTIYVVELGE